MTDTTLAQAVADGTLTELPFDVVLGAEGLQEDFGDFPFEEFTDVPEFASSATIEDALFDFAVSVVNDAGEAFDGFIDDVAAVTTAALAIWSEFIVGAAGADIDVAVTIADLGPGTVASATAGSFFIGPENDEGVTEILTSAQVELITGADLNGDAPDVIITVNSGFLTGASFDTDPDRVALPGVIDFVSVLAHEINHSLGFLAFRDNSGEDFTFDLDGDGDLEVLESTFGTFVDFNVVDGFLTPTFDGENLVDIFGEAVVLESTFDSPGSDISHFALFNPDGSIADTALALENPSVIPGDIVSVGALELAVLADLGFTIDPEAASGIGLVNALDSLPFTPTVSVSPQLSADGDTVSLTLEFDAPSLFVTLPSSVGVTVTAPDGTEQTLRARFAPGETTATVELDAATFFDTSGPADFTSITGNIDVELFFPAQAQLENGGVSQTVAVTANLISGTEGDDDIDGGDAGEQLFGGSGNDVIDGGNGQDTVVGGNGNDELNGGNAFDQIFGGDGDDIINESNGNDTISGGDGNDEISDSNGFDLIDGGAGDDTIESGNGGDTVFGGEGDDEIIDQNGFDAIDAGAGNDFVDAGNGGDTIFGGDGDDTINAGDGFDQVDAGTGDDIIEAGNGSDTVFGSDGDDLIDGGNGFDVLAGGAGSDTLSGGNGNDDFILGFGNEGDTDIVTDLGDFDELVLDGFAFQSAQDVLGAASQVGDDVVILLDEATNQTVILQDLDLSDLQTRNIRIGDGPDALETFGPFESFVPNDIAGLL